DHDVGTEAAGQFLDGFNCIDLGGIHGVGGAELLGAFQLVWVYIHRDDGGRPGQLCAGNCCCAYATATDDGDGLAALDLAGVDGGTDAGHDAAAEQAYGCWVGIFVNDGALACVDQGLLGEGSNAQCRGELGAIFQGHLLGGVEGVEAVLRFTLGAGAALAAYCTPVKDDAVAYLDVGDV